MHDCSVPAVLGLQEKRPAHRSRCAIRSAEMTRKVSELAPGAKVIHVDIDPAEIGKIRESRRPHAVGDVREVILSLADQNGRQFKRPQNR